MNESQKLCVLVADDDPDDQYMLKEALSSSPPFADIRSVNDGEELLDYLYQRGKYSTPHPVPAVILLDLNMPKKDGRECLRELKKDARLSRIPVVVFSTSNNQDDVAHSYEAGASSYLSKPYSYNELVELMDLFKRYWLTTVKMPTLK